MDEERQPVLEGVFGMVTVLRTGATR